MWGKPKLKAMPCDCSEYQPISLDRESVSRRIRQSPAIRKRLFQIAENAGLRICLLRCAECGQFWQSGHEWNFADEEYLFQVPPIEIPDWLLESYRQPAAMLIYSAVMRSHFERVKYETTDSPCRFEGCHLRATRFSIFCRDHHIESLQQLGKLPKKPVGRLFPPYFEGQAAVS